MDRETVDVREWLAHLIEGVQQGQAADREASQRRLGEQRQELYAHTLAVTREGWQFITGGAACTAIGLIVSLAA